MAEYHRDARRSRPMASNHPGLNTTRKQWTNDNGVQFTLETSSYSTPGVSFGSFSASSAGPFRSFTAPTQTTQPRANGMVGAAFGLLGDILSAQQQQQRATRGDTRRGFKQPYIEEDLAHGDGDDVVVENNRASRPKGFISKVAERLVNNSQRSRRPARNHERSPVRRAPRSSGMEGRSGSYHTEERHPPRTGDRMPHVEDTTDEDDTESSEDDYEDSDESHGRHSRRSTTADEAALIDDLEHEAEDLRTEMKDCRKRLEQASRRPNINAAVLQGLINELKGHEDDYATTMSNLESVRAARGGRQSQGRTSRPSQPRQPFPTAEHIFTGTSIPAFEAFFGTGRSSRSVFADIDDLHAYTSFGASPFGGLGRNLNEHLFFGMPRTCFVGGSTTTGGGHHFRQTPSTATFPIPTPNPKPPRSLLKPEEAKQLFQIYNERWNALTPVDPGIPFPCRGMQAAALNTRDAIWAPLVSSPIATWSEETVMQANAQAFFLGVVGLTPQYTEAPGTGRIVMGYDKARASPEQLRELVEILKKEKTRWHSDRLGRRNGGVAGPNEVLQRDERARAVFHAVCELMEVAQ